MTTFADALDSLWNVQRVDALTVKAQRLIERAESAIAKADGKVAGARTTLKEAHDKLQHMRATEKEHEDELSRLDDRVKQLEAQGTEAGNKAAARQREKIDEIELAGIELLGEISDQEDLEKLRRTELEQQTANADAEKETAVKTIKTERSKLEDYAEKRKQALENIVPKLLEVYDIVNNKHPGNALVGVNDRICRGCSGELTMQLIQQIKARAEIVRCPLCDRLLDIRPSD